MSAQNRMIVGVVAMVATVAGFWFLVLAPKRADVSAANDQIARAESRRDAAMASAAQAAKSRANYLRDYKTVAKLGKAVPADDDVASLVYQLESIARTNGIDFRGVKLTGAASAPPAAAVPANTAAAGASDKADGAKADEAASAPTVVAPVVAQPPPGAVVGSAGLLTVPFTLTFNGDYMKLQRLLKAINGLAKHKKQNIIVQGRLLTVDGFSLAASPTGFPKLKATVSATAYIVPPTDSISTASPQAPAGAAGAPTTTALTTRAQGAGR